MNPNYYLRALIICCLLWLPFSGWTQNPFLSVTTTDCSTWDCSPCDGTFTLTLNNPNGPGPYTFWLMDTTNWTIVDSITTMSTTHTFTGLCAGYYHTDLAWQNNGGNPCSNCIGGTACPQCPPTGSGTGGGAGGTIGAPTPGLNVDYNCIPPNACFGGLGAAQFVITGDAPPFQVDYNFFNGWGHSPMSFSSNGIANIELYCGESPGVVTITDASGQSVSVDAAWCFTDCGYSAIMMPIPTIEVCAGQNIGAVVFDQFLQQGLLMAPVGTVDYGWQNDNTLTGIPSNGTGSLFQYTAANVTTTQTSLITVEPIPFNTWPPICDWFGTTFQVIVHPNPIVNAGPDIAICEGQPVLLSGTGNGNLSWSNGVPNNSSYTPIISEDLILTSVDNLGCTAEDTMSITFNPSPIIDAGPDIFDCEGASIVLNSPYPNSTWSGPASSGVVPAGFTDLVLTVNWNNGCTSTDTVVVFGEAQPVAFITPDLTVCEGDTVVLSSAMSANGNFLSTLPITSTMPFNPVSDIPFVPPVGVWTNSVTGNIQWCTDSDVMTLTVLQAPTLNAGPDVTICSGDSVQLNAIGNGNISWSTGTANGGWYTPTSSGMAVATLIDANGCEVIDTLIITFNPVASIDAGTQQTICSGESVTLFGSGGVSYVWDNGVNDGVPFNPTSSTWYTVTGTDANGCSNQDSVEVIVNALPVINAGTDTTVCENEFVTLAGSGGVSYSWSNGVIDNTPFAVTIPQTYIVTGTDANGCQSTDSLIVSVNPLPLVDAGNNATICFGDSVQLSGSGAITYSWNNGVQNDDFVQPLTTTTYLMEGTDVNGCSSLDSLTISIITLPTIDAGSNIFSCEGDMVTLNAAGSSGNITWNGNPNPFSVQVNPDSTLYFATIVDASGCAALDSVWVIGDPIPQVEFSASTREGCSPLLVEFTNLTIGNINDCSWDFGNGITASGCSNQSTVYTETGYYDVSLTVSTLGGCSNSATYTSYVYVEPDPIASFAVTPTTLSELEGYVQTLNSSVGATSYQWDFGDNSGLKFGEDEDHTYPAGIVSSYTIELVAFSPLLCSDTAWRSVQVEEEVIFYVPNSFSPDGDAYNNTFYPVITSGIDIYDFQFIIFNRWGQQVFITNDPSIGWDGTYNGRMSQDGTYNWRMEFKVKNGDERQIHYGHVNLFE